VPYLTISMGYQIIPFILQNAFFSNETLYSMMDSLFKKLLLEVNK